MRNTCTRGGFVTKCGVVFSRGRFRGQTVAAGGGRPTSRRSGDGPAWVLSGGHPCGCADGWRRPVTSHEKRRIAVIRKQSAAHVLFETCSTCTRALSSLDEMTPSPSWTLYLSRELSKCPVLNLFFILSTTLPDIKVLTSMDKYIWKRF